VGHEIVDEIALAQPTISRHLSELRDVGLIKGDIDGNKVRYCIDAETWMEVRKIFDGLFDALASEQDCC
jgi:DNA-binding transcriptional ArsR family regulator